AAQLGRTNQILIFRRERGVKSEEITLREQFVERDELNADLLGLLVRCHVVAEQFHSEAGRAPGHRLPDASAAKNAERLAVNVVSPRQLPFAAAHDEMALMHAPR